MILSKYLASKFIKLFFAVLLSVSILTFLIDLIELIRKYGDLNLQISHLIKLSLLKQPALILEILPFTILLGSILFFAKLSNNSEITIIRSSGKANHKIFLIPIITILIISLIEAIFLTSFAAKSNQNYDTSLNKYVDDNIIEHHKTQNFWFKYDESEPSYIFNAKKITFKNNSLLFSDIDLIILGKVNQLYQIDSAHLIDNKKIIFTNAKTIDDSQRHKIIETLEYDSNLNSSFVRNKMFNTKQNDDIISIKQLVKDILILKKAGISHQKQTALLNSHIARPIFYIIMLLLAAYLCIYPPRYQKKILNIILAVAIGFISFFILNIMASLVASGKYHLIMGIWLPHLFLLMMMIFLLIRKEQGYQL